MAAVVDSSVIVAALIDTGPDGRWAESVIAVAPLYCPEHVLAEASNVLRRLELQGKVSQFEANLAQRDLLRLRLDLFPFRPFAQRVWAMRRNVTAYDAWYAAVAEAVDCPLFTLDRKLSRASGLTCAIQTPPHAPPPDEAPDP